MEDAIRKSGAPRRTGSLKIQQANEFLLQSEKKKRLLLESSFDIVL